MSKLCPSAQPGMDRCMVLGVGGREGDTPIVQYLNEPLPATPEVLAMAAPLNPTEVFRLSATCEEHKCPHYDGKDCWLAESYRSCQQSWTHCHRARSGRNAGGFSKRAAKHASAALRSPQSATTY